MEYNREFFKHLSSTISNPFVIIFQTSINTGELPEDWKCATSFSNWKDVSSKLRKRSRWRTRHSPETNSLHRWNPFRCSKRRENRQQTAQQTHHFAHNQVSENIFSNERHYGHCLWDLKFNPVPSFELLELKHEMSPNTSSLRTLCPSQWTTIYDTLESLLLNYHVLQSL